MAPIPEGTWDKIPAAQRAKHKVIKKRSTLLDIITRIFVGQQKGEKIRKQANLPEPIQGEHEIYRARDNRNDFRTKS